MYDPAGQVPLALISNGSFASRQALFTGFETYEDLSAWTLASGAAVTSTDAHTGSSCLSLPSGASVTLPSLTPDGSTTSIFSFWVCTPSDFVPGSDCAWSITLDSGTETCQLAATDGAWQFQSVSVSATTSATISLTNSGSATVLIDDVALVPLAAEFSAQIYDDFFRLPSAHLDECGHTWRTFRDNFMREVGGTSSEDLPVSLQVPYFSAVGNSGVFSSADPNVSIGVKAFGRDSTHSTSNWTATPPGSVDVVGGTFVHEVSVAATLSSNAAASADFALFFEVQPLSGAPLQLTDDFSIVLGSTELTLSVSTGQWNSDIATFSGPLSSCLLVQTGANLMLWCNGQLVISRSSIGSVQPSLQIGTNTLAVTNLILLQQPAVSLKYSDATGAERQDQWITAERYVVQQTVRDARGSVVARTKLVPGSYGSGSTIPVGAYRTGVLDVPSFLAGLDASAVMTGDAADWYNGTNDTDDQGYCYTRTVLEASPLGRTMELGLPGQDFAVINIGTTTPASRATSQIVYGSDSTVPFLNLTAGEFGQTTQISPSKVATSTVNDASSANICRFTTVDEISYLASLQPQYGNGDQQAVGASPNSYLLNESGQVNTTTQNSLQQLLATTTPDAGTTLFLYDAGGNIRFAMDAAAAAGGYFVYMRWDPLGRPLSRGVVSYVWNAGSLVAMQAFADDPAWPEDQTVVTYTQQRAWTWDGDGSDPNAIGHLVQAVATTGETTITEAYTWNPAGLLATKVITIQQPAFTGTYTITFQYDLQGRLLSVGYPDSANGNFSSVCYSYDGRDSVLGISDDNGLPFAAYSYSDTGALSGTTYGSGTGSITGTWTYDSPGRLLSLQVKSANSSYQFSTTYDTDGYVASIDEQLTPAVTNFNASVQYGYDSLKRLQSATDAQTNRSLAISYTMPSGTVDGNGNIQSIQTGGNTALTLQYAAGSNQVTAQQQGNDTLSYRYAANGAIQQIGDDLTLAYLPGGLLPESITANDVAATFAYDVSGRRVTKQLDSGLPSLLIHGGFDGPMLSIDSTGAVTALVYGPGGLVAFGNASGRYSVATDYLGSPRLAWDSTGTLVAAYAYNAYGLQTASFEPTSGFLPLGFTGQQLDGESGLFNFHARMYNPFTGRFLSPDPRNQFPSSYCYVGNLPTMLTDKTGKIGAIGEAALDAVLAIVLVTATIATAGAAATLVPLAFTASGVLAAVATGAAVGAVGGAISNAAFQGLYYGIVTPPGNWSSKTFGKDLGAGAIGGFLGGAVTGGFSGGIAAADLATAAATTAVVAPTETTPLLAVQDDFPPVTEEQGAADQPSAQDRASEPNQAQSSAQKVFRSYVFRPLLEGGAGAVGGGVRGYVQQGFTNLFNDQSFNKGAGLVALEDAASGAAGGAVGGLLGQFNQAGQYSTRFLSSVTSAFTGEQGVAWKLVAGLGGTFAFSATVALFYARTGFMEPSTNAGN